MQKFFLLINFLCFHRAFAQTNIDSTKIDSTPPYLKTKIIPSFKILKMDSTYFYKYQLKKNMPTVIVYFGPTCGHCQTDANKMVDSAKYLKKAQIIFISSSDFFDIKKFTADYKLNKIKNCIVGRDEKYYVTRFYKVIYTPFVAVYDKNGNLIKVFEGGASVAKLTSLF